MLRKKQGENKSNLEKTGYMKKKGSVNSLKCKQHYLSSESWHTQNIEDVWTSRYGYFGLQ